MDKYQIGRDRFSQAEFKQERYYASIPADTKPESLLDSSYFAAVSGHCRPSGVIWAEWEDGTLIAELWIQAVGQQFVMVKMLRLINMAEAPVTAAQEAMEPGYKCDWGGSHHKHRVIRLKDNQAVSEGHATRAEAQAWLTEHMKAQAR